jgi:hypothetical protein
LTGILAHAILCLEIKVFSKMQESDRETGFQSELPPEPRLRAISSPSLADESTCMAVEEPLATPFVQTVVQAQQADSRSLQSVESMEESGTLYTLSSPDALLQCLEEAARIQQCRVSLLVHDRYGWHELFFNRKGTIMYGISASYVRDIVANNDLELWMDRKSTCTDSDDKHEISEIDGYQLVIYTWR